jgi:hypothetical protein
MATVAVAFSMAWAEARAPGTRQIRHGNGWQGSAGSCTGASPPGRTRCLSRATRRCASRTGAYAGGIVAGARASARPWRLVRRVELRESAGLATALGTGRGAAADLG